MSLFVQFLLVVAFEVAGFFVLWFLLRARIRRFLEIENLMEGVREEARALIIELNESADRSVSLVEDRMSALRGLLDEVDRRMGLARREQEKRVVEREIYTKLAQRRPIVPQESADAVMAAPVPSRPPAREASASDMRRAEAPRGDEPIPLQLGEASGQRRVPDVRVSEEAIVAKPSMREEALTLYRKGFSADIIAARLGATVAEIELLVEIEERRSGG